MTLLVSCPINLRCTNTISNPDAWPDVWQPNSSWRQVPVPQAVDTGSVYYTTPSPTEIFACVIFQQSQIFVSL